MSALVFIPAFFLGFPMVLGIWMAAVHFYKILRQHMQAQTAMVFVLCTIAAALSLMTAPVWLLGWQGYAVVAAVYAGFVGFGAPHMLRTLRFLALELDGDPNNNVPLPDENSKKN